MCNFFKVTTYNRYKTTNKLNKMGEKENIPVDDKPKKVFNVTLLLNDKSWHEDIKRYVFYKVGVGKIDIIVTDEDVYSCDETDLRIVNSLLDDDRFESVVVTTSNHAITNKEIEEDETA